MRDHNNSLTGLLVSLFLERGPGVTLRRPLAHAGLRRFGVVLLALGLFRVPLPQADFHNIRHHDGTGEVCPHHDHLLRWHPKASQNEDVAMLHWHWFVPQSQAVIARRAATTRTLPASGPRPSRLPGRLPRARLECRPRDSCGCPWPRVGEPGTGPLAARPRPAASTSPVLASPPPAAMLASSMQLARGPRAG